jgi:hypothetical protein
MHIPRLIVVSALTVATPVAGLALRSSQTKAAVAAPTVTTVPVTAPPPVKAPSGWVPAGGYLAASNLVGTPGKCDTATGKYNVDWEFTVKSDTVGGFLASVKSATAGGIPLSSKTQPASSPAVYHTLSWTGSGTYTGPVTQTITFDTLVNAASGSPAVTKLGQVITVSAKSPCDVPPPTTTTSGVATTALGATTVPGVTTTTVKGTPAATTTTVKGTTTTAKATSTVTTVAATTTTRATSTVTTVAATTTTTLPATTTTKVTVPATTTTVPATTTTTIAPKARPLLIQYGFDISRADVIANNAARVDALPYDGIVVNALYQPCSSNPMGNGGPVTLEAARADLARMPVLANVTHNFLSCKFIDDGGFDMNSDAIWNTVTASLAAYAQAAKETGKFDGIMIDPEYYGAGANPWDVSPATDPTFTLPAALQTKAQYRGYQTSAAMIAAWPTIQIFNLRGAEGSDQRSLSAGFPAWHAYNEMIGSFFVGEVEAALNTSSSIIDGGEVYNHRTQAQYTAWYNWLKTGEGSGGTITNWGSMTGAKYNSKVQVGMDTYDYDWLPGVGGTTPFTDAKIGELIGYARNATDKYHWLYTESCDGIGGGWPLKSCTPTWLQAIRTAAK